MGRPCDTGLADCERCTDFKCISHPLTTTVRPKEFNPGEAVILPAQEDFKGYHVNKTNTCVTVYSFDHSGKRTAVTEYRIPNKGQPRGTRELWAASILKELGFIK